jgi:hypothetical protein
MCPRNEVLQAVPFDTTSDAREPLIATSDAREPLVATTSDAREPLIATSSDTEEEDQGLEERALSSFKILFSTLGVGSGFFIPIFTLGANSLVMVQH